MDIFMPVTLERVYDRLNFIDPAVKYRPNQNHWGGSVEIGGSPREGGTRLTPTEIVNACRDAVQSLGVYRQSVRFLAAAVLMALITAASVAGGHFWPPMAWLAGLERQHVLASPSFGMHLAFLLITVLALVPAASRRPWQFGLSLPVGKIWWALLPLAALGGLAGGVPPTPMADDITPIWGPWVLSLIMMPIAVELAFRSLAHGFLAQFARIGRPKGRLLLSWPLTGAALLFAGFILWQNTAGIPWADLRAAPFTHLQPALGAFLLGLVFGFVRERSQSIVAPIIFHMVSVAAVLATITPTF
jgi:membrane protease YdiL (CAAX protease family)